MGMEADWIWVDFQYAMPGRPPAPAPASFHAENMNALDFEIPVQGGPVRGYPEELTRDRFFGEQLREFRTTSALKDAIRELDIDLRQEPSYSRRLFDHLLSLLERQKTTEFELVRFLDDPHLNVSEARNYHKLVEYNVTQSIPLRQRNVHVGAILRALELGLVSADEIGAIVQSLSDWSRADFHRAGNEDQLAVVYRKIWDAIGKCDIYGHRDLDVPVIDQWLGILLGKDTAVHHDLFKDILMAADYGRSWMVSWVSNYLFRWLHHPKSQKTQVVDFLEGFDADLISLVMIHVTECLCAQKSSMPEHRYLFRKWGTCLSRLHDASAISSSWAWTHLRVSHTSKSHFLSNSARHLIVQRLWMIYAIIAGAPTVQSMRSPHPTTKKLLRMYESARSDANGEDLWEDLMHVIHALKIPFNLPAMLNDLRTYPSNTTDLRPLQRYKGNNLAFPQIFFNLHSYNASGDFFFHNIDRVIRQVDVTSPDFLDNAIRTAKTSDGGTSWTILRLLRSHTPLKIALSRAWPILNPADKALVRYYPYPRGATEPDPHKALDMIHDLAVAFAFSEQISPRRAFKLVRWLYLFLDRHGGPVRTPLVDALYYAGVVRFRKSGRSVGVGQLRYISHVREQAQGRSSVLPLTKARR